jgi:hypothetical protein
MREGGQVSAPSRASCRGHPARYRGRSGPILQRAAGTSTIALLRRSGMQIAQHSAQNRAIWRVTQPCVITSKTDCPVSSLRRVASPSMGLLWYGKDGGPFIGKVGAGPVPGARNRSLNV